MFWQRCVVLKKIILSISVLMLFICLVGCSSKKLLTASKDNGLKNYENKVYNISLKYNSSWKLNPKYNERYEGKDGFFQVSATDGQNLKIDQVAKNDATHILQPFGSNPEITKLTIQGQEARFIMPSADQIKENNNQAELIVKYPQKIKINGNPYSYLIIWADKDHIREISQTIKFLS